MDGFFPSETTKKDAKCKRVHPFGRNPTVTRGAGGGNEKKRGTIGAKKGGAGGGLSVRKHTGRGRVKEN